METSPCFVKKIHKQIRLFSCIQIWKSEREKKACSLFPEREYFSEKSWHFGFSFWFGFRKQVTFLEKLPWILWEITMISMRKYHDFSNHWFSAFYTTVKYTVKNIYKTEGSLWKIRLSQILYCCIYFLSFLVVLANFIVIKQKSAWNFRIFSLSLPITMKNESSLYSHL